VAAFRLSDGAPLWTQKITTTPGQGVDMQTLPYGGRVYIASVPVTLGAYYKGGSVGYLEALDASTGKVDWSFDTVRSKDLWGHPAVNSGGGAWYPRPSTSDTTSSLGRGQPGPARPVRSASHDRGGGG
jgi:outer membrane protein assembly factor BamB